VRKFILNNYSDVKKIEKERSREWLCFPKTWARSNCIEIIVNAINSVLDEDQELIKVRKDIWKRENQSKDLFDELLLKLCISDEYVFRNSNTTFLCPYPGFNGECLKSVYDILKKFGHSNENIVGRIYTVLTNSIDYYNIGNDENYSFLKDVKYIETEEFEFNNIGERFNMKFDVIISNPPYQKEESQGSHRGSSTNALWFDITKKCLNLCKQDGYMAFITPTNLFSGGESYSKNFIGENAKFDIEEICFFDGKKRFPKPIGIDVCYWVLRNSNKGVRTKVSQGNVNLRKINVLFKNATITNIIDKVLNYDGIMLDCSQTMRFEYTGNGKNYAKKNNIDLKLVEPSKEKTKTHKYPFFWKGELCWIGIKWKSYGIPKVIIPRFKHIEPFYSSEYVLDGDSMIRVVKDEYEGKILMGVLNTHLFKSLFNMMRTSGRIQPRVKDFKIPSLTKEWTEEELCKEYGFTNDEMECIYGGKCK
jgi:hypothetical protein